ncbi:DMT family transporter [Lyngbya sp. CCY1209]|uniref:DMT family transporter n=1 Tax=Lyngbya sp. CCY1209 TaxID=2886103 RepID=UPI002D2125A4|nr:DMT family transporter [Lyngbya sp. CCY1209]MEB3887190.1 DMT family transporter [Lyngbya sp. CCY1209]
MKTETLKTAVLPLIASLLLAGAFIAGKFATADLSPLVTSWLRFAIALGFLSGLAIASKPSAFRVARSDLFYLVLLGVFGIVGYHYFFFASLQYTTVGNTAIIKATNPAITAFFAAIALGEKLTPKNYWGGVFAFAGVITLLTGGRLQNLLHWQFNRGDGLMLMAVFCWMVYSLLLKVLSSKYSVFTLTYYAILFGVILLSVLTLREGAIAQIKNMSWQSTLSVFYMGIGASGIGYLQYSRSVAQIGPTRTASFVDSFVPIFVSILALIFFREAMTPAMVGSAIAIVFGINFMLASGAENDGSKKRIF